MNRELIVQREVADAAVKQLTSTCEGALRASAVPPPATADGAKGLPPSAHVLDRAGLARITRACTYPVYERRASGVSMHIAVMANYANDVGGR